jgi:hypothetical protein
MWRTVAIPTIWNESPLCCVPSRRGCAARLLTFRSSSTPTLASGGNLAFVTQLGSLDLLAYPAGSPAYDSLREAATVIEVRGHQVRVASLDHLIAMKEATGRPRDKARAQELRMLSDELRAPPTPG